MHLTSLSIFHITCTVCAVLFLILFVETFPIPQALLSMHGNACISCKRITIIPVTPKYNGLVVIGNKSYIDNIKSIGNASIDPCLWGIREIEDKELVRGQTRMMITNGALHVKSRFDMDNINMKSWQVIGYNEIIYGMKPWGMPPSHHIPEQFKLPERIDLILRYKHIYLYVNYCIEKANVGIDLSYDIWIKKTMKTNGIHPGDLEIMIWLYHKSAQPAGKKIGSIDTWAYINNSLVRAEWSVYLCPRMSGGWTYIALVLDHPIRKGSIMIDLIEVLRYISQIMDKLGINLPSMYLMDIELGSEIFFGRDINVEWYISKYLIIVCIEQNPHMITHEYTIPTTNNNTHNPTRITTTSTCKATSIEVNRDNTPVLITALALMGIIAMVVIIYMLIMKRKAMRNNIYISG